MGSEERNTETETFDDRRVLPVLERDVTWPFTLRMSENRVLRRIFRLKREEVTVGCRYLHNEMFHNLHCRGFESR
jgi:hypothetical protein